MGNAHDRGLIAKTIENRAPGYPGLRGIVVGHHAKFWVFPLKWRMDHVPGDQHVRSGAADQHREMIDRMTGRRNEFD